MKTNKFDFACLEGKQILDKYELGSIIASGS